MYPSTAWSFHWRTLLQRHGIGQEGRRKSQITNGASPANARKGRSVLLDTGCEHRTHLLLLPQSQQSHTRNLDDLDCRRTDVRFALSRPRQSQRTADSRNISLCLSLASETRDEDLVVLIDKVQASIVGNEGGDCTTSSPSAPAPSVFLNAIERTLLSVLDELNTDTLSDGRVRLLGLDSDLLEHDALGVGGSTGGGRAVSGSEGALLVVVVGLGERARTSAMFFLLRKVVRFQSPGDVCQSV